jgi:hypothetical protein
MRRRMHKGGVVQRYESDHVAHDADESEKQSTGRSAWRRGWRLGRRRQDQGWSQMQSSQVAHGSVAGIDAIACTDTQRSERYLQRQEDRGRSESCQGSVITKCSSREKDGRTLG